MRSRAVPTALEQFAAADILRAREVMTKYEGIALADASLVVLAERHGVRSILTLDVRHFAPIRLKGGARFTLLPR
jgi:predicted nucleic acid-binding protein